MVVKNGLQANCQAIAPQLSNEKVQAGVTNDSMNNTTPATDLLFMS